MIRTFPFRPGRRSAGSARSTRRPHDAALAAATRPPPRIVCVTAAPGCASASRTFAYGSLTRAAPAAGHCSTINCYCYSLENRRSAGLPRVRERSASCAPRTRTRGASCLPTRFARVGEAPDDLLYRPRASSSCNFCNFGRRSNSAERGGYCRVRCPAVNPTDSISARDTASMQFLGRDVAGRGSWHNLLPHRYFRRGLPDVQRPCGVISKPVE